MSGEILAATKLDDGQETGKLYIIQTTIYGRSLRCARRLSNAQT